MSLDRHIQMVVFFGSSIGHMYHEIFQASNFAQECDNHGFLIQLSWNLHCLHTSKNVRYIHWEASYQVESDRTFFYGIIKHVVSRGKIICAICAYRVELVYKPPNLSNYCMYTLSFLRYSSLFPINFHIHFFYMHHIQVMLQDLLSPIWQMKKRRRKTYFPPIVFCNNTFFLLFLLGPFIKCWFLTSCSCANISSSNNNLGGGQSSLPLYHQLFRRL